MISFLKLIRWPNLLIVLISMLLILLFVINPVLGSGWFAVGLSKLEFSLLILATLFITIGGYLINDFFDMDADRFNKPGKNQVGLKWPVSTVQLLYWVFTIGGVGLGVLVSWMVNQINYSLIFVFSAGMLWFYSERYQCIPVVGNIVVAFLSTLSFGLVWLYQFFALSSDAIGFTYVQAGFPLANRLVLIYMTFAFVTSFLREVLKDIEDKEGDEKFGCNTMAVVYGIEKSKVLAIILTGLGLAATIWIQMFFKQAEFWMLFGYFFLIDLLFIICLIQTIRAKKKADFRKLSNYVKWLMVIGILSMILIYFEV